MVLSLILTMFCLLLCVISFLAGFGFGHLKSEKKFVLNINLLDIEEDNEPEGDGELMPANVTPIRSKEANND